MPKTRIQLTDSMHDIIFKMSDGNPGALTALVDVIKNGAAVDPDDAFGGLGMVLWMDTHKVYGSDIYVLWHDVCGRNLKHFIAAFRAAQLNLVPVSEVKDAINRLSARQGRLDFYELTQGWFTKVQERLPNFGKNA